MVERICKADAQELVNQATAFGEAQPFSRAMHSAAEKFANEWRTATTGGRDCSRQTMQAVQLIANHSWNPLVPEATISNVFNDKQAKPVGCIKFSASTNALALGLPGNETVACTDGSVNFIPRSGLDF